MKKKYSTPLWIFLPQWHPQKCGAKEKSTFCAPVSQRPEPSSIFMRGDTNIFSLSGVNCQAGKQGRKSIQSLMLQSTYKALYGYLALVFNNVASTVRA